MCKGNMSIEQMLEEIGPVALKMVKSRDSEVTAKRPYLTPTMVATSFTLVLTAAAEQGDISWDDARSITEAAGLLAKQLNDDAGRELKQKVAEDVKGPTLSIPTDANEMEVI